MHVSDPDKAVPLDPVPDVVLHVEVDGVGAGLPDLVEPFVIALEASEIGYVPVAGDCPYRHDGHIDILAHEVEAYEAETGVAELDRSEPGNGDLEIPDGVLVGRCASLGVDIAHGFSDGFSEANMEHGGFLVPGNGTGDFKSALHLLPEIQEHGGLLATGCLEHGDPGLGGGNLAFVGFHEVGGSRDGAVGLHDPDRSDVVADEFGVLSQRVLRVERSCKGQCGHNQGSEVSFVVHVK